MAEEAEEAEEDDGLAALDAALERAAEARAKADLETALERWWGGDITAFAEAVRAVCRRHADVPWELVEASRDLVARAMSEDEKRARREYCMHLERWEAVTELLERSPELLRAREDTLKRTRGLISSRTTDAQERARLLELLPELVELASDDREKNLDGVFEVVSEVLKRGEKDEKGGKVGKAGKERTARAVEYSYRLIEAAGGGDATFESYKKERQRQECKRQHRKLDQSAPD